jgi:hypothetical protein
MNIVVAAVIPSLSLVLYCPGINSLFHFSNDGSSPAFTDILIGILVGLSCLLWCEAYKIIRYGFKNDTNNEDCKLCC